MQITKKHAIGLGRLVGKSVALGALALVVAGCVAEPSPHGYYGYYPSYPNDYSYYDAQGNTVVVVHDHDSGYQEPVHNYDDHWEYGRRGNGNYHGTDRDDVHDD